MFALSRLSRSQFSTPAPAPFSARRAFPILTGQTVRVFAP